MRKTYRVLAYIIAALIVVQAASMVFAIAGLGKWVEEGGVLDKAAMEDEGPMPFPEIVGFIVHGMNGQMLIPLVALILLVISFFAKIPKGSAFAGAILGLIVVQVLLGLFSVGAQIPLLGLLHGANALLLFTVVLVAARRAGRAITTAAAAPAAHAERAGV
jgi:heme A synthase